MMGRLSLLVLSLLAFAPLVFAPRGEAAQMRGDTLLMTGAGSTFINPLFSKWFAEYNKENPKVELNYQSIGSGGGIKQLQKKTIDFAASDVPMTDQEMSDAGGAVLHFPVAIGAVVLSYNLPMLKTELKLDSDVISAIVRGQIKKWNDPKIQALNSGVQLPDQAVVFVYRSDSSGTTGVFTDYLGKADPNFAKEVGVGKAIKWPTGLGGKGNEGVTANIKNTVGSIGYVELTYALSEKLPRATLKNREGKFVKADLDSVTEAAGQAIKTLPADFRGSLTMAAGAKSYPIAAFTYLLAYPKTAAPAGKEIERVLTWAFDKGQAYSAPLGYSPLPKTLVTKLKAKIKDVSGQ
ncbi:MAG: phosphate ABC transporter substrate-binding protein PstS [Bdellovibrionaceae bacterium]|nr:phosphate ABC transporter substrate-binding protein PstS [Pseudobdellovibrionaceae bacterium]